MSAITIQQLNNAALDAQLISDVSTSQAMTATDRLGNTKSTVLGAVNSLKAFNARGAFVAGTAYALKDVYTFNNLAYVAVLAHTSSSVAADLAAANVVIHQGATREDLLLPSGSSAIGFLQAGTGAVARTMQNKNRETLSLKDFGAVGDGIADDTAAINAWLLNTSVGKLTAPAGTYKFTSAIVTPPIDGITIEAAGRQKTKFVYSGAANNIDLWTIGDGVTSLTALSLKGFNIDSTTLMIAGTALRINKQQNGGTLITDISFSRLNAPQKLWDGIWFNNTNVTTYRSFDINVQNSGVIVNGVATSDSGSDLILDDGIITFAKTAIHCGGGFGGLYLDYVLLFGNQTHFKIDNARAARYNREIIVSDLAVFDGCKDYGIYVNDPLAAGSNLTINGFIGSAGRIGTGGVGVNVFVQAYPNSRITIGGGQLFNAISHGIQINDASTLVSISDNVQITNNGGYGINASVASSNVNYQCNFQANGLADVHPNVRPVFKYAPTVLSSSGTLTQASGTINYHRVGNRVDFDLYALIANNGTGSGTITCSFPFIIRQNACAIGNTDGVAYKAVFAKLVVDANYMQISFTDGTYPGASGQIIVVSGSVEVY